MTGAFVHPHILMGLLMLSGLAGGCAGVEPKPEVFTVSAVDLTRYAGTWYEIARLPMWFQRHCVDSRAVYTIRAEGTLGVHNECVTGSGEIETAEGIATVVDTRTPARLSVRFENWFARPFGSSREGNYWILDLDPDYRTTVVGTPDRRYLWILAREPSLDQRTYGRLVDVGRRFGYPVDNLIRDRRADR
ncbi:MAG TPA: lipocalin family protein [Nitrospira sp.]|nr:lipocalin family protein [Nitrospira sp.]